MVFRFILRILANNEHLVQRLSESYPIRRAAQLFVLVFHQGKGLLEDSNLKNKITPEQFRSIIQRFAQHLKQIQEQARKQK